MAYRCEKLGIKQYVGLTKKTERGHIRWTGEARFVPEMLELPLKWRKPRRIFVNSMSDLFHSDITNEQIAAVFGVMAACQQHTFQVLTKRPERMLEWFKWVGDSVERIVKLVPGDDQVARYHLTQVVDAAEGIVGRDLVDCDFEDRIPGEWPLRNVWLGVSCEDQQRAEERIPHLLDTPAAVRFISAEPLLAPIDLRHVRQDDVYSIDALTGDVREGTGTNGSGFRVDRGCVSKLDWVIAGGESGPGARRCDLRWLLSIVEQCQAAKVPAFCKQLGARPFFNGRPCKVIDRKGGDMGEFPEELRVRDFPEVSP